MPSSAIRWSSGPCSPPSSPGSRMSRMATVRGSSPPTGAWPAAALEPLRAELALEPDPRLDSAFRFMRLEFAPRDYLAPGAPREPNTHHLRAEGADDRRGRDLPLAIEGLRSPLVVVTLGTNYNRTPRRVRDRGPRARRRAGGRDPHGWGEPRPRRPGTVARERARGPLRPPFPAPAACRSDRLPRRLQHGDERDRRRHAARARADRLRPAGPGPALRRARPRTRRRAGGAHPRPVARRDPGGPRGPPLREGHRCVRRGARRAALDGARRPPARGSGRRATAPRGRARGPRSRTTARPTSTASTEPSASARAGAGTR